MSLAVAGRDPRGDHPLLRPAGFTRSPSGSPPAIVALLNAFFERTADVIFAHGGTLDRHLGEGPDGALRCAGRAAGPCLPQPSGVRWPFAAARRRSARSVGAAASPPLRRVFGLTHRPRLLRDIGTTQRRDYTIVGDAVNVAARLQELTRSEGVDVLVRTPTGAARRRDRACSAPRRSVHVRGRRAPLEGPCRSPERGQVIRARCSPKATTRHPRARARRVERNRPALPPRESGLLLIRSKRPNQLKSPMMRPKKRVHDLMMNAQRGRTPPQSPMRPDRTRPAETRRIAISTVPAFAPSVPRSPRRSAGRAARRTKAQARWRRLDGAHLLTARAPPASLIVDGVQ